MAGNLDFNRLLLIAWLTVLLTIEETAADEIRVSQVGSNLQLPCTPSDAEEIMHYFTWSKNGELVRESSSLFESRFVLQSNFSLLINNIEEEDEGNYSCYIMSNPPVVTVYNVQVRVPAAIEQYPSGGLVTVEEGGAIELVCLANGRPIPEITWKYEGNEILNEYYKETTFPNSTRSSVYQIQNTRRNNSGRYVCNADNGVDVPAIANFHVQVNYAPEIIVEKMWVHAGLGTLTELVCHIDAVPTAQVTWYRESNDRITTSKHIIALSDANGAKHTLRFGSVRDVDFGVYTCKAENILGLAQASIEISGKAAGASLRVAPPRDGNQLETEGRRHRLIWEVISHTPIIEYRLWLRPRDQKKDKWINITIGLPSASTTSFLHSYSYILSTPVTDGNDGTIYEITVQSRNKFGWSAESNVVRITVGTEQDAGDADNSKCNTPAMTEQSVKSTTMVEDTATSPQDDIIATEVTNAPSESSETAGPSDHSEPSDFLATTTQTSMVTDVATSQSTSTFPTTTTELCKTPGQEEEQATSSHSISAGTKHLQCPILLIPVLPIIKFSLRFGQ